MPRLPDTDENRLAAGQLLRAGGVIAYPTDTLYGLGASVFDSEAVGRVFAIKGRATGQGLPVLVDGLERLEQVADELPAAALELARKFWPGPLTLVLPRHPGLPEAVTGGDTVAVRQPAHPSPLALIAACGSPITGTSANRSGGPDPATAAAVIGQLGASVDLVLDGGPASLGAPSTVLDVTVMPARLLRAGALPVEELRRVCAIQETAASPA